MLEKKKKSGTGGINSGRRVQSQFPKAFLQEITVEAKTIQVTSGGKLREAAYSN